MSLDQKAVRTSARRRRVTWSVMACAGIWAAILLDVVVAEYVIIHRLSLPGRQRRPGVPGDRSPASRLPICVTGS